MGEPAKLTEAECESILAYANRVFDAVVNDEEHPQPRFDDGDAMPDEVMIFKLAQLVLRLQIDQGLACALVINGGAYQVTDECIHISRREWDQLQAQLESYRESSIQKP